MNAIATSNASGHAYGELIEPTTLKIERLLPGPIERVWSYLTESELRKRWLAAGDMEMKVGASFEFIWRNDELSPAPGKRPEGFAEEMRMASRITELDPPRKISFTWAGSGDVTFELAPKASQVLLTITHRRLPDRDTLLKVAGGWHMHLEYLVARTGEKPLPADFWVGWARLRDEYDRRLPA
jgi:uncharacterized protein YndB with AHSA1/START domain